jgi:hypothetical protein
VRLHGGRPEVEQPLQLGGRGLIASPVSVDLAPQLCIFDAQVRRLRLQGAKLGIPGEEGAPFGEEGSLIGEERRFLQDQRLGLRPCARFAGVTVVDGGGGRLGLFRAVLFVHVHFLRLVLDQRLHHFYKLINVNAFKY